MKGKEPKSSTNNNNNNKMMMMKSSIMTWDGNVVLWTKGEVHRGFWYGYLAESEGMEVYALIGR
jgi:hypothetical protein